MNLKKTVLAVAAGAGLFAAVPAFAHGWERHHRHPQHFRGPAHVYSYPARPVVVVPPPVYYAPPRVYYAPPPRVYYAPAPVIYGHIPVRPGVAVSFGVRL